MHELNALFRAWVSADEREIIVNEEGGELLFIIDYEGFTPRGLVDPRVKISDYFLMGLFNQMKSFIEKKAKEEKEKETSEED